MWPATRKTHQRRSIDSRAVVIMSFFIPNSHSLQMLYGVIEPLVFGVKNWETIFCPFKKTAFRISYFCPLLCVSKENAGKSSLCDKLNWCRHERERKPASEVVDDGRVGRCEAKCTSSHWQVYLYIYIVTILFCESCVLCIVMRPKNYHLCITFFLDARAVLTLKGPFGRVL